MIALLVGCDDDLCSRHSDCAAGQTCTIDGRCTAPQIVEDAGISDGEPDATAPPDAGELP